MGETRELSFELERFEWADEDRLEVSGNWHGLTGRRLARPVLTVEAEGRRRRLNALPGGQLPRTGGEAWRASFAWPHGPVEIESAELEIGRNLVVDLPAPRRRGRRSSPARSTDEGLRSELDELRAQIAELRALRPPGPIASAPAAEPELEPDAAEPDPGAPAAAAAAAAEEHDEQLEQVEAMLAKVRKELERAEVERERAAAEREGLREELERSDADRASLREELANVRSELDALKDQHAALVTRSGDLRGQLAEAIDAQDPLTEELGQLRETKAAADLQLERLERELKIVRAALAERERELAGHGEESEQRLAVERAHTTDVREKLATAREEAKKALAAEAAETERIRTELATAREDAERLLAEERAEVARLREELAARPAVGAAETGEHDADDAHRRMYERISKELESERATISRLRRELDEKTAETAEQRRHVAAAATNGVHTATDEAPVAMTPAGRAGRRAAAVLASRAEADARAPYRRVEAARAAAAQRVPEPEHSPVGVWVARSAAIALVALLLIALAIIVSSIA